MLFASDFQATLRCRPVLSFTDYPTWVGKTVTQLRDLHHVVALAVWRDGEFHYSPAAGEVVQATDALIAFAPKTRAQAL